MAYQNVGTPRIYLNIPEYLASTGVTIDPVFRTLPVSGVSEALESDQIPDISTLTPDSLFHKRYVAILGHGATAIQLEGYGQRYNIVNGSIGGVLPGFSIIRVHAIPTSIGYTGTGFGSVLLGTFYDFPNTPNLSLTMSREYGGTKEFTTHNGSSMSNTMWSKTPMWGNLGAWELDDGNFPAQSLSKSGRRTWQLKFSYMDDSDLWGSNQMLSYIANTTLDYEGQGVADPDGDIHTTTEDDGSLTDEDFNYNLLSDDNFFSQVWHKTLGGTLPFIFQPDNSNNNPDQFCIAKFKNNSLKATQSSHNVYDISLSIEEVW